jgi:hypothetical protein
MPDEDDPYTPLFQTYRRELRALYEKQVGEREAVVRRIMDRDGVDEKTAREIEYEENGPLVQDGRAVHLIRRYWLEIARLKDARMAGEGNQGFLEPLTFLVEYLTGHEEDGDLVDYLTEISYWPIGIDEKGRWS